VIRVSQRRTLGKSADACLCRFSLRFSIELLRAGGCPKCGDEHSASPYRTERALALHEWFEIVSLQIKFVPEGEEARSVRLVGYTTGPSYKPLAAGFPERKRKSVMLARVSANIDVAIMFSKYSTESITHHMRLNIASRIRETTVECPSMNLLG